MKFVMRKLTILLYTAILMLVSCSGLTGQETDRESGKYPLVSFSVRIGDSYYHASIDQESHIATIGYITDTRSITGIEYTRSCPEGSRTP